MNILRSTLLSLLLTIPIISHSQDCFNSFSKNQETPWFISSALGIQISGINPKNFTASNIAPSLQASIGKWISPEFALQLGYKGRFFHTISDPKKHYYDYILGEVLININELVNSRRRNDNWSLIIHPGAGYFYNYDDHPNFCGNFGIMNTLRVAWQIDCFIDLSAIMGWDIYQGNKDILPSCVLGICYSFR